MLMHTETHREYLGRTHNFTYKAKYTPYTPIYPLHIQLRRCYPYPHAYWPAPLPAVATYPASREREKSTIEKGNRGPKRAKRERGKESVPFPPFCQSMSVCKYSRCPRPHVRDGVTGAGPRRNQLGVADYSWAWWRRGILLARGSKGATARF